MHDLRKKALLESGKTVSRKARAKPESARSSVTHSPNASPGNSRPASRAASRPGSRYTSEDESLSDDEFDDHMTLSTNSASGDERVEEERGATWTERLQDRLAELQDRKRSSVQGRESTLVAYIHLLRHHYAARQIENHRSDIVAALLKSIRGGSSSEEQRLALKALSVTIVTCPSDTICEHVFQPLKSVCQDAEEASTKVEAIRAMSVAITLGGGSSDAADETLDFLLEIIESDGRYVDAGDNGPVVAAALQAWAFIASHSDESTIQSDQAMEAFMEQLDSTDVDVQSNAGSNIALLFEAARDYEDETGESSDMQYNQHRIMSRMTEIVKDSSKAVSKKERRHLRNSFASIVTSLERGKGPGYSTAGRSGANPHVGGSKADFGGEVREFGYREKIRIRNMLMVIDTWALQARVELLKNLVGGGFAVHFMENPTVRTLVESADIEYLASPSDRRRNQRDADDGPRRSRRPR